MTATAVEERILSHGQLGIKNATRAESSVAEYESQKIVVGPVVGQGGKKVRFKDLEERGQDSIQDQEDLGEIPEEIPEEIPDSEDKIDWVTRRKVTKSGIHFYV